MVLSACWNALSEASVISSMEKILEHANHSHQRHLLEHEAWNDCLDRKTELHPIILLHLPEIVPITRYVDYNTGTC
jgi:hypothetical protein